MSTLTEQPSNDLSNLTKCSSFKDYLPLKALDTFGNCQRPVFLLDVYSILKMHRITNLWKFELNWSSKLQDNNEEKKHPGHTKCVLLDVWFRDLTIFWGLEFKFEWKIKSFSKTTIRYFRESRFSQCFILLYTALHCLLPSKFVHMATIIFFF